MSTSESYVMIGWYSEHLSEPVGVTVYKSSRGGRPKFSA